MSAPPVKLWEGEGPGGWRLRCVLVSDDDAIDDRQFVVLERQQRDAMGEDTWHCYESSRGVGEGWLTVILALHDARFAGGVSGAAAPFTEEERQQIFDFVRTIRYENLARTRET